MNRVLFYFNKKKALHSAMPFKQEFFLIKLPPASPELQMIGLPLAISIITLTLVRIIAITSKVPLRKVSFFNTAHDNHPSHEGKGNQNK
jgi:hypothetical protein